jgi:radical SAM protein with 4Fe4S-binding SPASM domain
VTTLPVCSLVVSEQCNIDCSYCYVSKDIRSKEVSNKDTLKFVAKFVSTCVRDSIQYEKILLHGSEPTTVSADTLAAIFKLLDPICDKISLQTNGVNFANEDYFNTFISNIPNISKLRLGLSLDGPAFIHDKQRDNSHSQVIQTIENFKSIGFNHIGSRGVITSLSLRHVDEIIEYFKELEAKYSIKYEFAYEDGTTGQLDIVEKINFSSKLLDQGLIHRLITFQGSNLANKGNNCNLLLHSPDGSYGCNRNYGKSILFTAEKVSPLDIVKSRKRMHFRVHKDIHPDCQVCEYVSKCHSGCPATRVEGKASDCEIRKFIFSKGVELEEVNSKSDYRCFSDASGESDSDYGGHDSGAGDDSSAGGLGSSSGDSDGGGGDSDFRTHSQKVADAYDLGGVRGVHDFHQALRGQESAETDAELAAIDAEFADLNSQYDPYTGMRFDALGYDTAKDMQEFEGFSNDVFSDHYVTDDYTKSDLSAGLGALPGVRAAVNSIKVFNELNDDDQNIQTVVDLENGSFARTNQVTGEVLSTSYFGDKTYTVSYSPGSVYSSTSWSEFDQTTGYYTGYSTLETMGISVTTDVHFTVDGEELGFFDEILADMGDIILGEQLGPKGATAIQSTTTFALSLVAGAMMGTLVGPVQVGLGTIAMADVGYANDWFGEDTRDAMYAVGGIVLAAGVMLSFVQSMAMSMELLQSGYLTTAEMVLGAMLMGFTAYMHIEVLNDILAKYGLSQSDLNENDIKAWGSEGGGSSRGSQVRDIELFVASYAEYLQNKKEQMTININMDPFDYMAGGVLYNIQSAGGELYTPTQLRDANISTSRKLDLTTATRNMLFQEASHYQDYQPIDTSTSSNESDSTLFYAKRTRFNRLIDEYNLLVKSYTEMAKQYKQDELEYNRLKAEYEGAKGYYEAYVAKYKSLYNTVETAESRYNTLYDKATSESTYIGKTSAERSALAKQYSTELQGITSGYKEAIAILPNMQAELPQIEQDTLAKFTVADASGKALEAQIKAIENQLDLMDKKMEEILDFR